MSLGICLHLTFGMGTARTKLDQETVDECCKQEQIWKK